MTHAIKDYLLVQVPEVATNIRMAYENNSGLMFDLSSTASNIVMLPPGNWQYITTSELISEERAEQICPGKWPEYFENSTRPGHKDFSDNIYRDITALESFKSLLKSLNVKRAAVLKNQENNVLK